MSDLIAAQANFAQLVAKLIQEAPRLGYVAVLGEAWRPPEMVRIYAADGRGSGTSVHPDRLAVDLLLFRDGEYLRRTEDYAPLGKFWKALDCRCRWGGDFKKRPDGNHYSFVWNGRC